MNSLSVMRIFYELVHFLAKLLWIHYLSRDLLSFSEIHYWSYIFSTNLLWIHYHLREFTIDSRSFSLNNYEFTHYFANLLWNCYFFVDWLSFHYFFANSLWIHYLCGELTMNLLLFCEFTMNSLSVSWSHYERNFLSLILKLLFVPKFDFLMTIFDLFWPQIRPEIVVIRIEI